MRAHIQLLNSFPSLCFVQSSLLPVWPTFLTDSCGALDLVELNTPCFQCPKLLNNAYWSPWLTPYFLELVLQVRLLRLCNHWLWLPCSYIMLQTTFLLQMFHNVFITSMLCSAESCDSPNSVCCISVVVFIKQICNLIREWHQIYMVRPVYHKTVIASVNYISILDYFN